MKRKTEIVNKKEIQHYFGVNPGGAVYQTDFKISTESGTYIFIGGLFRYPSETFHNIKEGERYEITYYTLLFRKFIVQMKKV
jgi:hypothetical protein